MKSYNLINGHIITLNKLIPMAETISIEKGKIIAINDSKNNFQNIDLNGNTVIPGFIDSHFHLKNYGKRLCQLNLKGTTSRKQIQKLIQKKLKYLKPKEWLIGFGWDQNLWKSKQYPNKFFLNTLGPKNPIYLTRIDGHCAWVNNAALKLAKTDIVALSLIKGGNIINECILIDNAMNVFKSCLPQETIPNIKNWIKIAIKEIIKKGITGIHDAWQDKNTIIAIKELIAEDSFPIRCYGMLAGNDLDLLDTFFQQGHYKSEYLTIRSVKAFIDGAFGSRGAALHKPYLDDLNNCGLILISKQKFQYLVNKCSQYKYQLNTHAIGDRGNSYVLDEYCKALKGKNNFRWRIEHAQMVNNEDLLRFKNYSVLPSMQPSHCTSDMKWLKKRLGTDRLKLISRWQSFYKLGIPIPGGSDCPIEEGNPLFEFYAAITRQNHQGKPVNGWQSQEKIIPIAALKMFTTWGAYGSFVENKRGIIKEGYDADLTILSDNLLNANPLDILNIEIKKTIINGKIVFNKP